jgi:hypothetical protein
MAVPIDGGSVDSFYVQLAGKILGPCKTVELRKLPGFVLQTLVRPVGSEEWFPAFSVIDLKAYMNPNSKPLVIPTAAQIFNEIVMRPVGKVFTILFRSVKWVLLIGILGGMAWAGVLMSRHDGRVFLKNQMLTIESYLKAQGHQGVTSLIATLHDVDVVWFAKTAAPATHPIIMAVVKPVSSLPQHAKPKTIAHLTRHHRHQNAKASTNRIFHLASTHHQTS